MDRPLTPERVEQLKRIVEQLPASQRREVVGEGPPVSAKWSEVAAAAARGDKAPRKFAAADAEGKVTSADWAGIRVEALEQHGPGLAGLYKWQDARLVECDYPPTSAYWMWSLEEFFKGVEHEQKRWGIWLAGRGMGKSTTLTRVASVGGVWLPRKIPPRQRWVWPFVSVRPTDADKRIDEIQGIILDAYGIEVERGAPRGVPTLSLDDAASMQIAYNSLASTIGNVKGPSCIGMTLDEEAAMRAAGANPSGEIVASVIGSFRARDNIFGIRCSSAWERAGSHWNAVEQGSNDVNFVATIGPFLEQARAGFLDVAEWEMARGNKVFAADARRIAGLLTTESRGIPTWVGHPAITAIKSRRDFEALDDATMNELYPGLTRSGAWLREFGSEPPFAGRSGAGQMAWIAELNAKLSARTGDGLRQLPGLPGTDPRSERRDIGDARPYEIKEGM